MGTYLGNIHVSQAVFVTFALGTLAFLNDNAAAFIVIPTAFSDIGRIVTQTVTYQVKLVERTYF